MASVLVTGSCGFIGHHLVRALVKKRHRVVGVDDLSGGTKDYANLASFFMRRQVQCLHEAHFRGIDTVFHLAAQPRVPVSVAQPLLTHDNNVTATLTLLLKCRDAGVKRFIYSSSSSVYGAADLEPLREDGPTNPLSPYAVQKLAGEHYTTVFGNLYGMRTASLRYFNVFGEEQRDDNPYTGVITKFLKLRRERETLPVFGDGFQSRDFTYVGDVVRANILLMEKKDASGVYNVGTGKSTTINEIVAVMGKVQEYLPARPGDPLYSLADNEKLRSLGWKPTVSVTEWIKKQP